jgi:uncharacterized protein involved in exopolysaccharide biosynthesis/Mrp family chromosome partitioning ATPase
MTVLETQPAKAGRRQRFFSQGSDQQGGGTSGLLDVVQVFKNVWHNAWILVAFTLIAAILSYILVGFVTPKYRASSQLMLDPRINRLAADSGVLSNVEITEQVVATQIAVLRSNLMVKDVVDRLGLDQLDEFSDPDKVISFRARAKMAITGLLRGGSSDPIVLNEAQIISAVQQQYSIGQVGISNAINVQFESEDPVIAAAAANALVDVYIESRYEESIAATRAATVWLAQRTSSMQQELVQLETEEAEQRAQALQENFGGREGVSAEAQLMSEELAGVRALIVETDTRLDHLYDMRDSGGLLAVARLIETETVDQLREQQSIKSLEVAQADRASSPQTTVNQLLRAELAEIQVQLRAEANAYIELLEDELDILRARETALKSYYDELSEKLLTIDRNMIDIFQAERESAAARSVYEALLIRLNETRAQEAFGDAGAKQIVFAEVPSAHASPRRSMTVAASSILGASIALLIIFGREISFDRFRSLDELETTVGKPVFAGLPVVRNRKVFRSRSIWPAASDQEFLEHVRRVRSRIFMSAHGDSARFLMVTSSLPGEGKTETCMALATVFARSNRSVLLIDCNFANPTLSEKTVGRDHPGICDVLKTQISLADAISGDGSGINLLAAGTASARDPDLLATHKLEQLFAALEPQFDLILIDTPAVHSSSDSQTLGVHVDQTIVLYDYSTTSRETLLSCVRELSRSSVEVAGIVANRASRMDQKALGKG